MHQDCGSWKGLRKLLEAGFLGQTASRLRRSHGRRDVKNEFLFVNDSRFFHLVRCCLQRRRLQGRFCSSCTYPNMSRVLKLNVSDSQGLRCIIREVDVCFWELRVRVEPIPEPKSPSRNAAECRVQHHTQHATKDIGRIRQNQMVGR